MVLGGEDVATDPANVCAELHQGFNQYSGLNGHVQGAHDFGTCQRRLSGELLAERGEAGHFNQSEVEFFTTETVGITAGVGHSVGQSSK